MLHYFNVTCASAVADMDPDNRVLLQANVACVASEALMNRKRADVTTDVLLKAVRPFFDELSEHLGKEKKPPVASEAWITFAAVAAEVEEVAAVAAGRLIPKGHPTR